MKYKKRLIIIALALISIPLVIWYLAQAKKDIVTTPTLTPISITQIVPPEGVLFAAGTRDPIFIYTNKEIDPNTAVVDSSPKLEFDIKVRYDDPLRVIIQPRTSWSANTTYDITLRKGLLSKDSSATLLDDITASVKIEPAPELGGGDAR